MSVFGLGRSFHIKKVSCVEFGFGICWFREVSDWTSSAVLIIINQITYLMIITYVITYVYVRYVYVSVH